MNLVLLLDLDGTLVDPRQGITASIAHALTKMGRPVPPGDGLARFIGPPLGHVFQALLQTGDEALIRTAVDAYRERFEAVGLIESRVYPEIPAVLESLRALSVRLQVVTSKPAEYAEMIVRHHGLDRYVTAVYGPSLDALYESKGTLIRRAVSATGLESGKAMMVGDRKEDVAGARENGIGSVGVTWGYGTREELASADHVVETPADLVGLVHAVVK